MKKNLFLLIMFAALLGMQTSCNQKKETTGEVKTNADSVVVKSKFGDYSILVDVPQSGNKMLNDAILEYASETLGGNYYDDIANANGMLKFYCDSISKAFDEFGKELAENSSSEDTIRMEYEARIVKKYETPKLVTYANTCYMFTGGAHGSTINSGATFRKSDGRHITWDSFKDFDSDGFSQLIIEGLKKYFNVETDEQLAENLLVDIKNQPLPRPKSAPEFGPDGVTFTYQQYEIAAYAAGIPTATVPYEKIKPFMLASAAKLLE